MNELQVKGTVDFMGNEVKVIEGGFGENKRCLLVKDIALIHGMEIFKVNELINNHIDEFEENIDIIDLMKNKNSLILAKDLGLITNNRQKNCYLLSEQGYMLLVSFMKTTKAKEIRKEIRRNYFQMRETIKENNIVVQNETMLNDLINTVNNLASTVNNLILTINTTQNSQNKTESETVKTVHKEKFDTIESEITNLENEFLTVQEFCRFLNSKSVIPKKLGCQTLYQLLRDNNIINYYNTPIKNEYFNIIDNKMYLNKHGMIFIYNLAKENINVNYVVRHK